MSSFQLVNFSQVFLSLEIKNLSTRDILGHFYNWSNEECWKKPLNTGTRVFVLPRISSL